MLFRKFRLDWRYGVTELLIVVVGVLIALYADGWRQERQNRALEFEYLGRLAEDLRLDTAAVSNIMTLTEDRAGYGQTILSAFDTGLRSGSGLEFVRAVEWANYFSYPSYSRTTIDDLMSTGNLRLIRSTEVKDAVARYYAEIEWTEQFRDLYRPTQLALMQFIPEFIGLDQRYALFEEGLSVSCGPRYHARVVSHGLRRSSSSQRRMAIVCLNSFFRRQRLAHSTRIWLESREGITLTSRASGSWQQMHWMSCVSTRGTAGRCDSGSTLKCNRG